MNAYLFSSIQSAAYGNLFECSTHGANGCDIVFSSMSHENEVGVMDDGEALLFATLLNTEGLKAKFPKLATEDGLVVRHPTNDLTNHLASSSMPLRRFRLIRMPYCRSVRCVSRRSEHVWGSIATKSCKPKCGETPAPSQASRSQRF